MAILFTTILPAYSWHDGSGWLAWTMFSRSAMYRVHAVVADTAGATHPINPTQLASLSDSEAAAFLSGADRWRHATGGNAIASSMRSLARLACRCVPDAATATVTIDLRKDLDAPPASWGTSMGCP